MVTVGNSNEHGIISTCQNHFYKKIALEDFHLHFSCGIPILLYEDVFRTDDQQT